MQLRLALLAPILGLGCSEPLPPVSAPPRVPVVQVIQRDQPIRLETIVLECGQAIELIRPRATRAVAHAGDQKQSEEVLRLRERLGATLCCSRGGNRPLEVLD